MGLVDEAHGEEGILRMGLPQANGSGRFTGTARIRFDDV